MARPRHLLEYGLLRFAVAVVRSLGPGNAARTAEGIARLAFRLDGKHRRRALENLAVALPELDGEARLETARSAFVSFVRTMIDIVYLDRIVSPESVRRLLTIDVDPAATAALAEGRGAVFATAHLGSWEMTGAGVALHGYPLVSVARPIENPLIDRLLVSFRERRGQRIITKRGAVREMARTLREGGYLGILVDQNAGRRGVFVPFFGRLASTTAAPATLALRFRAPLIPAWQRRLPGGRHDIRVEAPIPFPDTGDRDEDVLRMTAALTARVEEWVRREPGQWLWGHRRWKTRPPGESSGTMPAEVRE